MNTAANSTTSSAHQITFRVNAPLRINGKWEWKNWTTTTANKIAAIADKARELGATHYDFSMSDHNEVRA